MRRHSISRGTVVLAMLMVLALPAFAKPAKLAVFVPGVVAGSPIYEGLVKGVQNVAAENPGSTVKVFEAGFNQAEWEEKLTSLAASGPWDLVVTSNPSLPALINKVSESFPKQKFVCLDAQGSGNPSLYTVLYNQLEQGYVTGYLAGLVSLAKGQLAGANADKKVGMLIGQHYPVMDRLIAPGFERGVKAADPAFQVDLRVLGNWYDATKAADLAKSMISAGADVILPICGSASQGVIKSAKESGTYVVFFDGDEFARAPKTVLGCTVLHQDRLAYAKVKAALDGSLPFGKAETVGMKDGYIEFLSRHPAYVEAVPAGIRAKVDEAVARIKSGALSFDIPSL